MWSHGLALACSCGLRAVTSNFVPFLSQEENVVCQRLREWRYEAKDKIHQIAAQWAKSGNGGREAVLIRFRCNFDGSDAALPDLHQ